MHYVKQFDINGVATKQVACIELHGKPNAATEGHVGVLGIDMDSPTHDVYKCCAVNGSIYTWELLSSGMSIINTPQSAGGARWVAFSYDNLKIPRGYVAKAGDLILDNEGYLYQIDAIETIDSYLYCSSEYTGTRFTSYVEKIVKTEFIGEDENGGNIYRQTFEDGYESDFVAPKGRPGTPGESAYDIAVSHGFEGTEEEWLDSISEKELNKNVLKMQSNLDSTTKRVTNLEAAVYGDLAHENEDNSLAYVKDVPTNALPFAEVKAIGGMTRKWNQLFAHRALGLSNTVNGVTLTVNNDGSITLNGQATSRATFGAITNNISVVGGHKYYIDCGDTTIHIGWELSTSEGNGNAQITTAANDLTAVVQLDIFSTTTVFNNKTFFPKIVDLTEIYGAGNEPTSVADCRITSGYEPYDEGSLRSASAEKIESVGVNKFDINNRQLGTIDSNGDWKCEERTETFYRYPFKENTRYTLSGYVKNYNTTGNVRFRVVYTDGTSENTVLLNGSTEWGYRTYTTEAGKTVDRITLWHGDVGYMYIKGGELMINEGTTALPYTPYVKHTLPIPEAVRALDDYGEGIPNTGYYNSATWNEDETRSYKHKSKRIVLDGVNYPVLQVVKYIDLYTLVMAASNTVPNTSVLAAGYASKVNDFEAATNIFINANNYILVTLPDQTITTGAGANSYLQQHPIECIVSQKETVTDISDILPADNLIGVEGGGTLTFKNEYGYDVPSEVTFVTKGASA